ncbi:MAG: ComF family protein [Bacteroidetes bacterium]|nr:MAG: ComF family protein [Bacteroidota bacterium]
MLKSLWINDLINLFYPNICQSCGNALKQQEYVICISCQLRLPKTGFHMHEENPVSRVFWGRVNIKAATSFLFFSKQGKVQNLIHQLKYRRQKDVGIELGRIFGKDLQQSPHFTNIDFIIPVPLHPKKLSKRGYNQSLVIAEGLKKSMGIEIFTGLQRKTHSSTQTKKSRYQRWENVKDIFEIINPEKLENKNILLIDDVLTTGATLEACAAVLSEVPNITISIATLAYAHN